MARKKRQPHGDRPKHRRPSRPAHSDLPDRRATEGAMQEFVHLQRNEAAPDTPLRKAQALMYQAFEEEDEDLRVQLAKEALEICPDCADAYVLLAEHSRSRKE